MIKSIAAWATCLILIAIVGFQYRKISLFKDEILRQKSAIKMSRLDIESFAERLAEEQMRLNCATYLSAGLPSRNTNAVHGFPLIQFGCIVNWPETWFISAYDKALEKRKPVRAGE